MPTKRAKSQPGVSLAAPIPILRSFDEKKMRDFYVGFLGFQIDWEHRFEKNTPLYLQVSRNGCVLQISEHFGDGTPGTKIKIETKGLDAYQRALLAKKYRHARPGIMEFEWGERAMTIADPFGNALIFFERIPKTKK